jgi:hypothetical protein
VDDPRRQYAKLIVWLSVSFAFGSFVAVFAIQQRKISLPEFRVMMFILVAACVSFYAIIIRKIRKLPPTTFMTTDVGMVPSTWTKVKIWNLRVLIALMIFSLVLGNWIEWDGPLFPRLIGTIANLGMTWLFVNNLRSLRGKGK